MAFPTKPPVPVVYVRIQAQMADIRKIAESVIARTASGPVTYTYAADYMARLKDNMDALSALSTMYPTKALADHAVVAQNLPGFDPVAEYAKVVAAANAVLNAIATVLPNKAGVSVTNYKPVETTFSTLETEGIRALLSALVATIDP